MIPAPTLPRSNAPLMQWVARVAIWDEQLGERRAVGDKAPVERGIVQNHVLEANIRTIVHVFLIVDKVMRPFYSYHPERG